MAKLIEINPQNPQLNKILEVVDIVKSGGLVVYPTDTVYGVGCDLYHQKAIQRLCQLKNIKANKLDLSFICYDLSDLSQYTKNVSNVVFKVMKKTLPGPYTFILESSNKVPKILDVKKKQVGIRVPDNLITRLLVKELGNPVLNSSIRDEDMILEYSTDPTLIYERFHNQVDVVIDGGIGGNVASTVINAIDDAFEVVRQGLGDTEGLF
jgi:tRNA threonylcarbamoyl adenosine modification protein (Sua5/YciO/YrdC/YwlC family)